MADKKIYFCEKTEAICMTDSCTEGQELQSIPDFDVPVESRIPSPGLPYDIDWAGVCKEAGIQEDPEWDTGVWKINKPDMDDAGYQMKFKDGTKKTWVGKLNFITGCENNGMGNGI